MIRSTFLPAPHLVTEPVEPVSLVPLTEAERAHVSAWKRQHQQAHAITPTDYRIPIRQDDEE